jgi:rod shape-determining protein MreD|tara:strand:- start:43 stop:531 length:489 start_codon:yes stop_codon:yes gene_type:complete
MKAKPAHGLWLIGLSFFVAFYLAALSLPGRFEVARPDWVGLMIIFWVLIVPERFGILMAFVIGLFYDTLMGTTLGLYGLVFAALAYTVLLLSVRLRMYPLGQQALAIFCLIGATHMLSQWLRTALMSVVSGEIHLWPALTSALLWPWVYGLLQALQLRVRVQ